MDYRRIIMGMQKGPKVDINEYCTFIARENGLTVSFSNTGLEYCINGGNWVALAANTNTPAINQGESISFRGSYGITGSSATGIGQFSTSVTFDLIGSCYTLYWNDEGCKSCGLTNHQNTGVSAFKNLFNGTKVVNINSDFLFYPAVYTSCYHSMFKNCTSLKTAPALPAMVMTKYCYESMFEGCTSLTAAPALPATTIGDYTLGSAEACYRYMFKGCTSLTAAPALPCVHLGGDNGNYATYCYKGMFQNCTSLTAAPALPAGSDYNDYYNPYIAGIPSYCYESMFDGCTSLTAAPALPALYLGAGSYKYMFRNCTSLTTAPALPAEDLFSIPEVYYGMFNRCTSLTTAPALPALDLTDAYDCYRYMFYSCTSLTTAPELPATKLASACYSNMFAECYELVNVPSILPAMNLTTNCYEDMFTFCSSMTTAPELPATTLADACYQGMFKYCTSLTTAPALLAKTLVSYCYGNMFTGCSKLNYVEAAFTTTPGSNYTSNWLLSVKSTGVFVKNIAAIWNVAGYSGVPSGWTIHYNTYN